MTNKRKRLLKKLRKLEAELAYQHSVTHAVRKVAKSVFGGNCTFVDDDMVMLAVMAKRAVDAGLVKDLHPTIIASIKAKQGEDNGTHA